MGCSFPTPARAAWRGRPVHGLALIIAVLALLLGAAGAAADDASPPAPVEAMRQAILGELALQPGMTVAEIGVGRGWFVTRAAEAVGPNGVVYGTDIDAAALDALRPTLKTLNPGAGRVELRPCKGPRDTGLDDLADGRVDVVVMVDSLCFDAGVPRDENIAYLRRFLRILRPGGRLVHHMDCKCDVSEEALLAQFAGAGFSGALNTIEVADPAQLPPGWPCRSETEQRRHALVGVFRKPTAGAAALLPGTPPR